MSEVIIELRRSCDAERYTVTARCSNCHGAMYAKIKKGVLVPPLTQKCLHCGCVAVVVGA